MVKYRRIILLIALILLAGCFIPIKQWEVRLKSTDTTAHYNEDGFFEVWIDQSDWNKTLDIVDGQSFAVDPKGTKYKVVSEERSEKTSKKKMYVIYLYDERNKVLESFRNGDWELSIHLQNNDNMKNRPFRIRLWTLYYNPIIYGAPN